MALLKAGTVNITGDSKGYEAVCTFIGDEGTATIKIPNPHLWDTKARICIIYLFL